MDPQCLIETFASLRGLMLDVQYQLLDLQNERNSLLVALDELGKKYEMGRRKNITAQDELVYNKEQVNLLTNMVIHNEEIGEEHLSRILKPELRSMKNNILITGLDELPHEQSVSTVTKLFKDHLKLDNIMIDDAFRIGTGDTRPMLVKLTDYKQKKDIFANANKLRTVKNIDGNPVFINNHLPEQINEEKRQHRQTRSYRHR